MADARRKIELNPQMKARVILAWLELIWSLKEMTALSYNFYECILRDKWNQEKPISVINTHKWLYEHLPPVF